MRWSSAIGPALWALAANVSAAPSAPPPVITPTVSTSSFAVDPSAKAAALRLAVLIYSEESQMRMAAKLADNELAPAFRGNKDLRTLDAQFPGFLDEIVAEVKPAFLRFTKSKVPSFQDRVADLIASRLDAAEIADLQKFYLTPTGQKLLRGMQQNVTAGTTIQESMADPDKPTSYEAVVADHKAAQDATKKLLDASDQPALLEFAQKPYFTRVAAMGPAMRKLEQDFSIEPAPEFEAEIEAIMTATIAKMEATKKK